MKNTAFFKYLFALLLFGSNGIVASFIALGSLRIVLLRTLIGSLLLIALFFLTGGKLTFYKHKQQFLFLAASGIAMGASWMFLYEAYARIGVGIASLLYYCGPVIVMVLSPLLLRTDRALIRKSPAPLQPYSMGAASGMKLPWGSLGLKDAVPRR